MRKSILSFILSTCLLSGCMTGTMNGTTSDGKPVIMNYQQNMMTDTYTTNIDGESFEGKAVPIDDASSFGTVFGSAYTTYGSAFGNAFGAGYSAGGKFKAILIGSKGSSLKCIMEYGDSSGLTNFGGVGECVHSDGRTLVVQW